MLHKKNRLTFPEFFASRFPYKKKRINGVLLYVKKNKLGRSRAVIVVSKKYDKRASKRNQIRRQIVEGIRKEISSTKKEMDLMIAIQGKLSKKQKDSLLKEILVLLKS